MVSVTCGLTRVCRPMTCAILAVLLQLTTGCSPDSVAPTPPPASATLAVVPSGVSMIRSRLAPEKCLSVRDGSTEKGTQTVLRPCTGGPEQQFDFGSDGMIRYQSTLCLDAVTGSGREGDAVIVWTCHGGSNQKWFE